MLIPVLTASNAVAAGRMMRITPLVPIGTTTTRTTVTTILACDYCVEPPPSVTVRSETEPAKCVEVHVFCCRACAYPPRRAGILNRI